MESGASKEIVLREDSVMSYICVKFVGGGCQASTVLLKVLFGYTCEVGGEISSKYIVQRMKLLFS